MANNEQLKIDNRPLVEAIAEMRKDFNTSTYSRVINLTLHTGFFIPAIITTKNELVQGEDSKLKFQDRTSAKFMIIRNEEKGAFFPVFTDIEQMGVFVKEKDKYRPAAISFPNLAAMTESTEQVDGFLINPHRENLPYTKQMLADIKKTIKEQIAKREQAAGGEPEDAEAETNRSGIKMTTAPGSEEEK